MNRYLAQEKRVFDISKFTVVGSPTITSDGVASGLNNSNYLTAIEIGVLKDKSWTIKANWTNLNITTPNTSNTLFKFGTWTGWGSIYLVLNNSGIIIRFCARTGVSTDTNNEKTWASKNVSYIPNQVNASISFDINTGTYTAKADWGEGEQIIGTYTPTTENKQLYSINVAPTNKLQIGTGSDNTYNKNATDLTQFKITVDGQTVFTGTKPVHLLERRKPKVWNKGQFTIVGNPSISEDGVASGFSSSNYLTTPIIDWANANNWELVVPYKFTTSGIIEAIIGDVTESTGIRLVKNTNDKLGFYFGNGTWISYNSDILGSNLTVNADYLIKLKFDGANYRIYLSSDNGQTYTSLWGIARTTKMSSTAQRIGVQKNGRNPLVSGSIDLKQFKIYTDNTLVFDGGAETYVYDPSKCTVVGTPTITEDGVASGFSGSNFIRVPIAMQNAWKIQMKSTFTNISDILSPLFVMSNFNRIILGVNGTITIFASEDNATAKSLNFNNIILSINKDYLLIFEFDGVLTYTFTAKDLNTNTEYKQSVALNSKFYNSVSNWAIGSDTSRYVRGSIDLPSFSITVDGKEVFTGAKENYYVLRS